MSLKSIKPIDDNKKIKDLPDGISGFINADNLHKATNGFVWASDVLNLRMTADIESTAHKTEWYFRLNKYTPDNVTFVGYISEQADSIINQNKDLPSTDIQVFPLPYGEYKYEREFDLNDKDLRITPRNIADPKISTGQWLVDVAKEKISEQQSIISVQNMDTGKNNNIKEKSKWFSMDNPIVYIITILILALIAYLMHKFDLPFKLSVGN